MKATFLSPSIVDESFSKSNNNNNNLEVSLIDYKSLSNSIKMRSGKIANICYSKKEFTEILNEDELLTKKRIKRTLQSGHHSVYGHNSLSFEFTEIPKSLVMILNNQNVYTTSEKSARYTQMEDMNNDERVLYDKWMEIFIDDISDEYGEAFEQRYGDNALISIKKLAQENARYMTSVFTPTKLIYTTNFRQFNYLLHQMKDFIDDSKNNTKYNLILKKQMSDFLSLPAMQKLYEESLSPKVKNMNLKWETIFSQQEDEFGQSYSVNYNLSFAGFAQAQRHRTINYRVVPFNEINDFFIPPILSDSQKEQWKNDLNTIKNNFPQAGLLKISERGTIEDFVTKCYERICGHAQLEIMQNSVETLTKYAKAVKNNLQLSEYLNLYQKGPACSFPEKKCSSICSLGPKLAITRLI